MGQADKVHFGGERNHSIVRRQKKRLPKTRGSGIRTVEAPSAFGHPRDLQKTTEQQARLEADRVARNRFVPPSVIINPASQIVHFNGNTKRFFRIATGRPTFDLFRIAHPDLVRPLRMALQRSVSNKTGFRIEKVLFQSRRISLEVIRLKNLIDPYFLIIFKSSTAKSERWEPVSEWSAGDHTDGQLRMQNRALAKELEDTRDYLHASQEQNGAAMADLQLSNEEITTANEELQSLIEELETSKEELRAANGELGRVNADLEKKVAERTRALEQANIRLQKLSGHLLHAQENERARIARELHDEVGQSLTAMTLVTDQLQSDETKEPVKNLRAIIAEIIHRIRTLSYELHPPILDTLGIHAALKWHFITFAERTKIKVIFKGGTNPEPSLTPEAKITLFRIAQEALNNVVKHAGSSTVHIRIYPRNNFIHLTISDKGKGFSVERSKQNPSLGLSGMKERLLSIGGTFHIGSRAGRGTQIHVSVPEAAAYRSSSSVSGGDVL